MTPERVAAAERRFRTEIAENAAFLRRSLGLTGRRLAPAEAMPLLVALRSRLEDRARREAAGYGAHRWLWYLRRVPDILAEGRVRTTLPYTLALAEVLTEQTGGDDQPTVRDQWISFKLDEHVARHVLALVCRTRGVFNVHRLIRTTGKGCYLTFDTQGYPMAECPDALERSMRYFDDRMAQSEQLLSRAGTSLPMTPAWTDSAQALLACFRMDPQVAELPVVRAERPTTVRVRALFKPELFSAQSLMAFNARFPGRWWQPDAMPLTLFLALCGHLLFELPNAAFSLAQLGYLSTSASVIRSVWSDHWDEAVALTEGILAARVTIGSPDELFAALRGLQGCTWPLVPPTPVRGTDAVMALDINNATSRLATAFEFPVDTGATANVRATHFEEEVQRVIDASPWAPPDALRSLRGRALRRDGAAITDLDAVGARDGVLLLVSAKSRLYTALYDTGEHVQVRNAATTVEQAVGRWREVVAYLDAHRRGDNYDFSAADHMIGVVCTPQVVWVPLGEATEEAAPGLRAASSAEELERWLAQS